MSRRNSRGISLAEVLVAITVLALAMTIAFVLYDGANRSFRIGDNLAEQQQLVRVAYDLMTRDLRLAGLNHNPDNDDTRPDEQIEAALGTAIVFRADFDGTDPALSIDPESDLADGGAFRTVSTGNDEIVGFVLAKDGFDGPDSFSFATDVVPVPRDGTTEPVLVDDVALTHDDPPYTLYRIRVAPGSTALVTEPVIDQVRELRFRYFDANGVEIAAPGGADDPAGETARLRATIRRIGIRIVGMTRESDPRWVDPDDPDPAMIGHRRFVLDGDVVPRNLGRVGLPDIGAFGSPPSQPPPPTAYPGHCGGLWVEWAANPPQDEVARYELRYGTSPSNLDQLVYAVDSTAYVDGLADGTEYWMTVEAVDDSGAAGSPSSVVSVTTANLNTPEAPAGAGATQGVYRLVTVTWDAVTSNVPPVDPSADPGLRDLVGYRVYRDTDPDFVPAAESLVATVATPVFDDRLMVHCRPYQYKVVAYDACANLGESAASVVADGWSINDIAPAAPTEVQAFEQGTQIRVRWDAVRNDAFGVPIGIDTYDLYREGRAITDDPPGPGDFDGLSIPVPPGSLEYIDSPLDGDDVYYYALRARDDCVPAPNVSALSEIASAACPFGGYVTIHRPDHNGTVTGAVAVDVEVLGGVHTYGLELELLHLDSANSTVVPVAGAGPVWSWVWSAGSSAWPEGEYRIRATVTDTDTACVQTSAATVLLDRP